MNMSDPRDVQYDVGHGAKFWISVFRALLLLTLGLSLLFIPDKTHKMLFNSMGLLWLTTGIVLVRQEARERGNRPLLALAVCGVVAGLLVLTRDLSREWVAEVWVKGLLGAIILLTGVLQTTELLRSGRQAFRGRPFVDLLLGVVTIVLGTLLILGRTGREQRVYYVAVIWALLGGGLILFSAVKQWLQERGQEQSDQLVEEPDEQASLTQTSE
jgi:uncharacterized membrane protein HdeD (DUF308 family)